MEGQNQLRFLLTSCGIPAKRYTTDHELIKFDDERGIGTVSITDYAQKSLGDVVFVELPEKGKTIEQGGESSIGPKENPFFFFYFFFGIVRGRTHRAVCYRLADSIGAVESVKAASDIVRIRCIHRVALPHGCYFSMLPFLGRLSPSTRSWEVNPLS